MLTSSHIKERILKAMKGGAKLYIISHIDYEGSLYTTGFYLERDGRRLRLNNPVEYPPFCDHPISAQCEAAKEIIKSGEVRQGYCFNSEYGREYREVYEHNNQPVPRWVTEQWGCDDDGNLIAPDGAQR